MWVEFVVGSLLCSERFFAGYFGFSTLLKKTNVSKLQFDQESEESGRRRTTSECATSKSLFIYLFIYLFIFRKLLTSTRFSDLGSLSLRLFSMWHRVFSFLYVYNPYFAKSVLNTYTVNVRREINYILRSITLSFEMNHLNKNNLSSCHQHF